MKTSLLLTHDLPISTHVLHSFFFSTFFLFFLYIYIYTSYTTTVYNSRYFIVFLTPFFSATNSKNVKCSRKKRETKRDEKFVRKKKLKYDFLIKYTTKNREKEIFRDWLEIMIFTKCTEFFGKFLYIFWTAWKLEKLLAYFLKLFLN